MPKKAASFEDKLQALEALVEKMEDGELNLEDSLKHFEQGIGLARECQTALKNAEQKVEVLLEKTKESDTAPFDGDDEK